MEGEVHTATATGPSIRVRPETPPPDFTDDDGVAAPSYDQAGPSNEWTSPPGQQLAQDYPQVGDLHIANVSPLTAHVDPALP